MKKAKQLLARSLLAGLFGVIAGLLSFGNQASSSGLRAASPAYAAGAAEAAAAPESEGADKTLSPYFFVKSDSPDVDQLPLKSTSAVVNVAGVIADVQVTQVYKNEGQRPIEAVYIFPASTRAAVYGMKMTIGERVIVAKIQKREEARAAYEEARKEGKSASLLEQQRPNVFQMNIANILPGDEVRTELSYTELLTPTDGVYEFVYPTVVGPRYSNQKADQAPPSEKWVANPYLHEKQQPTYTFDLTARLAAGMPIQEMACASHAVDLRYEDPSRAVVSLAPSEKTGGNKDFILKYRLTGERIESGLLLYQGNGENKNENFFLLMAQPPKRVSSADIPRREYIFIVDVSGSMHGFPLDISKKLLKDLIGGLRPTDSFNVLLFSGGSQLMSERSVPATPENIRNAIDLLERQGGGGGTELLPALQRVLALPRAEGTARAMIIATDGYVTVETQAFDLIRKHLGDASFFPFGIGSSVNRFLMEGMARAGSGESFVVANPNEAPAMAEKFRKYVQSPLLTRVKVDFNGFQAYDVEPLSIPDVFAERPVIVFGKWRGEPKGTVSLRGISGAGNYEKTIDLASVKPLESNSALRSLWARAAITRLSDDNFLRANDERVVQVTELGLKYSLLTAYTSFVAIDSQVRNKGGDLTTVNQPLPLPEGVSDYAVGGVTGVAPLPMKKMSKSAPSQYRGDVSQYAQPSVPPAPAAGHSVNSPPASAQSSEPRPLESAVGKTRLTEKDSLAGLKEEKRNETESRQESGWKVEIDKIAITGGASEAVVRKSLEEKVKEILECLPAQPKESSSYKVAVKWTMDAEGKVTDVKIISSKPSSRTIEKCLVEVIARSRFEAGKGSSVTVTATFLMKTGGK